MKNTVLTAILFLGTLIFNGCSSSQLLFEQKPVFNVVTYGGQDYYVKDKNNDGNWLCRDGKVRNEYTDHMTSDEHRFSSERAANEALIKYRNKLEGDNPSD